MRINRSLILVVLAILTVCFLGAAYAVWLDDVPTMLNLGTGGVTTPISVTARVSDSTPRAVHLTVDQAGIVKVTAADLDKVGLPFQELSSDELYLSHKGESIPFLVQTEGEEAALYFYSLATNHPQKAPSVYRLEPGMGRAMEQRPAAATATGTAAGRYRQVWEENAFFVAHAQGEEAWMGPLLLAPDSWSYTLTDIEPVGGPAQLTLRLFADTSAMTHHVEVLINGQSIGDQRWDGVQYQAFFLEVPENVLQADAPNTIEIVAHDDADRADEAIYIDRVELSYLGRISIADRQVAFTSSAQTITVEDGGESVLVFDVTEPQKPVHITALTYDVDGNTVHFTGYQQTRAYVALKNSQTIRPTIEPVPQWPVALRDRNRGADYIAIIADVPGFTTAIQPLLEHRRGQGLRVEAVPLAQIFDEFGFGHRDPEAIRQFLAYAAGNWQPPAPRYVLLVGDATVDLRDRVSGKNRNRLPTALVRTASGGYLASDLWFTRFGESQLPQLALGRLPAQNARQLTVMVDKTLAYERALSEEQQFGWHKRALLVADDEPAFDETTYALASALREEGYRVNSFHLSHNRNIHHDILSAINDGVALVNYVGFGSDGAWGDEAILQSADASLLRNGARLPILTTFTCRSGAFAEPRTDALAESLLRTSGGGVVAAIAPSGDAALEHQLLLTDLFYSHLLGEGYLQQDGDVKAEAQLLEDQLFRLGDAFVAAAREGLADEEKGWQDAIVPLNLLGDPALILRQPQDES